MTGLRNKTVLVTGGGRGIGRAVAEAAAHAGARLVVASRTLAELRETETVIRNAGSKVLAFVCDVGDGAAVTALFERTQASFGAPDVVVNAAAMIMNTPVTETTDDDWRRLFEVNVLGTFRVCREAFRRMGSRGGAIVNVSSLAGIRGTDKFPGFVAYTASKAAVVGMTEALAAEGRPLGIRVNAIAPGAVDTAMLRQAAPGLRTSTGPADIAPSVLFLADRAQSGPLTGTVLDIYCNE